MKVFRTILGRIVGSQVWLCKQFDRLLSPRVRVDGNADFIASFVPKYLKRDSLVYDIGGGKQPLLTSHEKTVLGLTVVGVDIDARELARAPAGAYDRTVCADITRYHGNRSAQLVICQALLEHVPDTGGAIRSISSILARRGVALLFIPSRTAWFARLNRILPPGIKRRLLFTVFPETERAQGFDAYYDRCTPAEVAALGRKYGCEVEEVRLYYASSYFSCFFPLYVLWRIWIVSVALLSPERAAETFSIALRRVE